MGEVKSGDTVSVHYTGKLDDGTAFDKSADSEPLKFKIGDGQLIPDFEQAVIGMNTGDSKTIKIPFDQAYGPYNKEIVTKYDRKKLPENLEPKVGQSLQLSQQDGQTLTAKVIEISESEITLDFNHPLAGKDLTFDIQLVEIA